MPTARLMCWQMSGLQAMAHVSHEQVSCKGLGCLSCPASAFPQQLTCYICAALQSYQLPWSWILAQACYCRC